jgi:hypothetical protein
MRSQQPKLLNSNSHFEVLAGIGRPRNLPSLEHEVEEMVPALTQEGARQGLQVLKEGLPGREGLPHQVVRGIRPPQHRMEQTREEIQRESHGRQVRLAMAVVMFAVVACGFQSSVVLVLDVPAGSSSLHD